MHDRGFSVSHVFLAAFHSVFLVIRNVHANTNTNVVASRQGIAPALSGSADPASFVNLFIGTVNGGHVFPGTSYRSLLPTSIAIPFLFSLFLALMLHHLAAFVFVDLVILGATLPHGMVKVGMDTDSPGNVCDSPLVVIVTLPTYTSPLRLTNPLISTQDTMEMHHSM